MDIKNPHYGGFWIRLLVALLDTLIIGVPAAVLGFVLIFLTGIQSLYWLIQLGVVVFVIYMNGVKGGTPGKLILKLRIVNEKGEYIGIPISILRYIGYILSGIILGIGFLMIAFTEKKQGLHDKIAKTFVVYVK